MMLRTTIRGCGTRVKIRHVDVPRRIGSLSGGGDPDGSEDRFAKRPIAPGTVWRVGARAARRHRRAADVSSPQARMQETERRLADSRLREVSTIVRRRAEAEVAAGKTISSRVAATSQLTDIDLASDDVDDRLLLETLAGARGLQQDVEENIYDEETKDSGVDRDLLKGNLLSEADRIHPKAVDIDLLEEAERQSKSKASKLSRKTSNSSLDEKQKHNADDHRGLDSEKIDHSVDSSSLQQSRIATIQDTLENLRQSAELAMETAEIEIEDRNASGSFGKHTDVAVEEAKMKQELESAFRTKGGSMISVSDNAFVSPGTSVKFPGVLEMRMKLQSRSEFLRFEDDSNFLLSQGLRIEAEPWNSTQVEMLPFDRFGRPLRGEHSPEDVAEEGAVYNLRRGSTKFDFPRYRTREPDGPQSVFLNDIAQDLEKHRAMIVYQDKHIFIIRDPLPKAENQFIVVAKDNTLQHYRDLRKSSVALIKHMDEAAKVLETNVRANNPKSAAFMWGFMAIPQFKRLHMHVVTMDFNSDFIRHEAKSGLIHFNSLSNRNVFKPVEWMIDCLNVTGVVSMNIDEGRQQLMRNPVCPSCGVTSNELAWMLDHIQKKHVATSDYHPLERYKRSKRISLLK